MTTTTIAAACIYCGRTNNVLNVPNTADHICTPDSAGQCEGSKQRVAQVLAANAADVERQLDQCRRWAQLLRNAGYEVYFTYTGERGLPKGYDKQWQVWTAGEDSQRIATIDIDGAGASWHGPADLWSTVIGPHEDLID